MAQRKDTFENSGAGVKFYTSDINAKRPGACECEISFSRQSLQTERVIEVEVRMLAQIPSDGLPGRVRLQSLSAGKRLRSLCHRAGRCKRIVIILGQSSFLVAEKS